MAEFNYDKESLQEEVEEMLPMANPNQKDIFNEVMTAIENDSPIAKAFFIQSAGGCGKKFTLNLLLKSIRLQGKIATAVASQLGHCWLATGRGFYCTLPVWDSNCPGGKVAHQTWVREGHHNTR